jgi:predicted permease
MKTSNLLRLVYGVTAVLIGVLVFFIIVGVFGKSLAKQSTTHVRRFKLGENGPPLRQGFPHVYRSS